MQQSIGEMSRKSSSVAPLKLETCEYLNISVCPPTSGLLDSEVSCSGVHSVLDPFLELSL